MASRWIGRPSSDNSWLGVNPSTTRSKTIGTGGNKKGSTISVNRRLSMPQQSSTCQTLSSGNKRQDASSLPAEKSPMYQNHVATETPSVSYTTVPGTVVDGPTLQGRGVGAADYNESQISSLGGTPRWQAPMSHLNTGVSGPPSLVEFRRTPPITNERSGTASGSSSRSTLDLVERRRTSMSNHHCSNSDVSTASADNANHRSSEFSQSPPDGNQNEQPHDEASNSSRSAREHCLDTVPNQAALSRNAEFGVLRNITNISDGTDVQPSDTVPEWDGCNPDCILKRLKSIPKPDLEAIGKREFYKSYNSWAKMTMDQRNKSLAYFRSLPEDMQGMHFFPYTCVSIIVFMSLIFFFTSSTEQIIEESVNESMQLTQMTAMRNTQTTKDDIVRLIHLFKEPAAQKHWCNLRRVMSRAELDSRKASTVYNEASNPLTYLAEIFNDYEDFCPQNVMVQYVPNGPNNYPVKKNPYQASHTDWAFLANFTHDLEPTNLSRRDIIRGEDWIKSTWTDCRKYLHQMFVNYNRSGQHDDDKDEWGSEKELQRWCRAANWKPKSGSQGTIIRYTSAMIYSIAVLELSDFEGIGRKMPKGAGVDATVNNGAQAGRHQRKKRKSSKSTLDSYGSIVDMLREGDKKDQQLVALRIFFECGNTEEKKMARDALFSYAFPHNNNNEASEVIEMDDDASVDEEKDDESNNNADAEDSDDNSSNALLRRVL